MYIRDTYHFSAREVGSILLMSIPFCVAGPAWGGALVISALDAFGLLHLPNVWDRMLIGTVIGYIGTAAFYFREAKQRKARFHPDILAEREARCNAERERIRKQNAERDAAAFPVRLRKLKELAIAYDKIPTCNRAMFQQLCAGIQYCKDMRDIEALDGSRLRQQISDAIWFYHHPKPAGGFQASGDDFYKSAKWRRVRADALHRWGKAPCCCCNNPFNGKQKHVDHIMPRSKYPHLALKVSNLQVMCDDCNLGKGNRWEVDWRSPEMKRRMGAA